MTADELSRRIFRSRTTISKLENARCRPDVADVMKILDVLEITGDKWAEMLDLAREAHERGWWDSYGDAMGARQRMYASLESDAATIRGYYQMSLPGLVQTPEFTEALIELDKAEGATLTYVPKRSLAARQQRQRIAFRPDGPSCEIVLDEFVLKRLAVPASVMVAQLRHTVDVLIRQPRFTIRVLPVDATMPPGRLPPSTFTIYTFHDPADPTTVVAENAATTSFTPGRGRWHTTNVSTTVSDRPLSPHSKASRFSWTRPIG
nr:helix-turn-helix transcriptional regulator [Actinomadura sp. CNU-125]